MNRFYDFIDQKTTQLGATTPEDKHRFATLLSAVFFSALCHVVQILFFYALGSGILISLNTCSLVIYCVCIVCVRRRRYTLAGILFSAEISVVGVIFAWLIGTDTVVFAYFFLILLIQMMIPYAPWRVRVPVIAFIFIALIAAFIIGESTMPVVDITPIRAGYSLFNLIVGFSGIISIVAANNAISKMIAQFARTQLNKYKNEAHIDALTGLYNRRYAELIFSEIKNDEEQHDLWSTAMLDIDDFKNINDVYGHDVGDIVLRDLAAMITSSLRKTDYVFRWGGEEFLLLLRNTDVNNSYNTLDKLRKKIKENEVDAKGQIIRFTVTMGLSQCTNGDVHKSISRSDENLYKGKRSGKNAVIL